MRKTRGRGSVVKGADTLTLAGTVALTIGDVLVDLTVAERALFRLVADERRRTDANFAQHELDALFAAHHAVKAVIGFLRARDPWKEKL